MQHPLMPLGLFKSRNVSTASLAVAVLWAAAMFAWFFISALSHFWLVLGYTPMQVGLGFLPANLIMATFSVGTVCQDRDAIRVQAASWSRSHGCRLDSRSSRGRGLDGEFWIDDVPRRGDLVGVGAGHRVQSHASWLP